jgi:ATP-binding cassette subfamily B protein
MGEQRGATDHALVGAVHLVFRAAPRAALAATACRLLQALTPLALVALSAEFLAGILTALAAQAGTSERELAVVNLQFTGGLLIAVLVCDALLRLGRQCAQDRLRQRVTLHVEAKIQSQAAALDLAQLETPEFQDLLHRAQLDASERPVRAFEAMLAALQGAITFVGATSLVALTAPWFLAAALPLAALAVWFRQRTAKAMLREIEQRTPEERLMRYLSALLTHPQHAKEVRVHGYAAAVQDRWRAMHEHVTGARLRVQQRSAVRESLLHIGTVMVMAVALATLVLETLAGRMSFEVLLLDAQALQRMFMALTALVGSLSALVEHRLWLRRLQGFFALRSTLAAPSMQNPVPRALQRGLEVRGVSFRHARSAKQALSDLTCNFRVGEITGLAGVNGAGKSTLIRLLARLADPDTGLILADGHDLKSFEASAWSQSLGVIFQDFGRYELPIEESVALGQAGHAQRVEVQRALQAASADGLVARLPDGLATVPGARFGRGELSLGEWQRLALARALLPHASVLLLDEPTASLDGAAEEALFAELRRRAPGRVIVIVAHRPSALALCDRVLHLHDGRLVADSAQKTARN